MNASDRDHGTGLDRNDAIAVLRWWRDVGVDLALGEVPQGRFDRDPGKTADPARGVTPTPVATLPPVRPSLRSDPYADLDSLRAALEAFDGCSLKRTATQLVFADGAPGSRVMLVGEAPGAEEDRIGKPFVGRAGRLLDRMLTSIGLDRSQVYIANVVPWRPPGNRTPTPEETHACLPFIRRQIELSGAEVLVCLGGSAAQTLLGSQHGITRVRGRWFDYFCDDGRKLRALAMFHPSYLLRQPAQKRSAWADIRSLAQALHPQEKEPLA